MVSCGRVLCVAVGVKAFALLSFPTAVPCAFLVTDFYGACFSAGVSLLMQNKFLVTNVDAKEYFKYTTGVLRSHVKAKHLDALRFTLKPVIEDSMGCKLIWSG